MKNFPDHNLRAAVTAVAIFAGFCFIVTGVARADGIALDITGQEAFGDYMIRDQLPEEPEKLGDDEVEYWAGDAVYQVERFYRERGYFQVAVEHDVKREDPAEKNWRVVLNIAEGKRYRFREVRVVVDGDSSGERNNRAGTVRLEAREDEPYLEEALTRDIRQLARLYGNAGFVRAEVQEEVGILDSLARADVTYQVTRGPAAVFDTLHVDILRSGAADSLEGLTREDLLRSLVPYRRGDTLRVDMTDDVIEKLQSTGLFHSVRLEEESDGNGELNGVLALRVEERIPGRIKSSVFYETQYGFGVAADVAHSNVAGSMNEVRLGAGLAQNKQNASVGYGSPLTFGMLLHFDDDLVVEWFQDRLPDAPLFGGDFRAANIASLSRNFFSWLRWVGGTELEYKSRVVSDSTGTLDRERGGILNFTNTGFVSFLDQALNPARGTRFALTWGNGGSVYERGAFRIFENHHNWLDAKTAAYYYLPPLPQLKAAVRLDGGRFFGAGGQNADRFFLGGPRNVRSYGFHQLCPGIPAPDEGSCPLQEEALEPAYILASAELRLSPFDFPYVPPRGFVRHFKPLEIVPFADYGKVWNLLGDEPASFSAEFLNSGEGRGIAYGGGIRYPLLGIFNFRLDLAWGRPGGGSWPDQWLVDLAQAF